MNYEDFTILVNGGSRCHWVSMCPVWQSHSKWQSKYSNKSASNFVLSLTIPPWELTMQMIQKATAMGNWWLAASSRQCAHSCITPPAEFFGETSNHPGDSAPYSPALVPCNFWLFAKLKSPLKGKRFQTIDEIQENTVGHLMAIPTKYFADWFE